MASEIKYYSTKARAYELAGLSVEEMRTHRGLKYSADEVVRMGEPNEFGKYLNTSNVSNMYYSCCNGWGNIYYTLGPDGTHQFFWMDKTATREERAAEKAALDAAKAERKAEKVAKAEARAVRAAERALKQAKAKAKAAAPVHKHGDEETLFTDLVSSTDEGVLFYLGVLFYDPTTMEYVFRDKKSGKLITVRP